MPGNQIEGNSVGRITSGVEPKKSVLATIVFIYNQLPVWRDDLQRRQERSEKRLNAQLCDFLDSQAKRDFPMVTFKHETPQVSNRSVDISAKPTEPMYLNGNLYTIYDPILVIECKRLPTRDSESEKEYVSGTNPQRKGGGIQRFKLCLHSSELSPAVMVGYIQDKDSAFWQKQVNGWICELAQKPIGDGCTWAEDETLKLLEECSNRGITKYISNHKRKTASVITIYHLWISMSQAAAEGGQGKGYY